MFEILSILMPLADTHYVSRPGRRKNRKVIVDTHEMSEEEIRRSHTIRSIPHNVEAQKYYLKKRERVLALAQLIERRAEKGILLIKNLFSLQERTKRLEVIDREIADLLIQLMGIKTASHELALFYQKYNSEIRTDPFDRYFRKELSKKVIPFSGYVLAFEYTVLRFRSFYSVEGYKEKVFEHISSRVEDKKEAIRRLLTGLEAFIVSAKTVLNKNAALVDEITKFLNKGEYKESRERFNQDIKSFNEKVEYCLSYMGPLDNKYSELIEGLEEHKGSLINTLIGNLTEIRKVIHTLHPFLQKNAGNFNSNTFTHTQGITIKMYVQYLSKETAALEIKSKQLKQRLTEINPFFVSELKMLLINTFGLIKKFKKYMELKNIH